MADIEIIKEEIEETKKKIEETKELLESPDEQELFVLAEEELKGLERKEKELRERLEDLLKKERGAGPSAVIIEIRAGTGGEEAALFSSDLFRMYSRYAAQKGWKQKVLDSRPTGIGGYKEIIFELSNENAWLELRYEAGVHRVQRIPKTEKGGRIHTSTASVAVLPKPKKTELKIKPGELKIDFYCASGAGGQYVQKRHTAVRITHLPTGLAVTSQTERNQLQNRENAMAILEARLLEKKQREEEERIGGERKTQIGWAMRPEKIRTYNFPQDRVTDHRLQKSWHNLERIIDGEIDVIIKSFQKKKNEATERSEAQH